MACKRRVGKFDAGSEEKKVTYGDSELSDHHEVFSVTPVYWFGFTDLVCFCIFKELADIVSGDDAGLGV